MKSLVVIAHNIRSTHNVGSFFRTAEGLGVEHLYFTGYTPYPVTRDDERLPHISRKLTAQIHKTALGAEEIVPFTHANDPAEVIAALKKNGWTVAALEQTPSATPLAEFPSNPGKLALVLGEEVHGIPREILTLCDIAIEIPMRGQKESFNVSVAFGIAAYALTS